MAKINGGYSIKNPQKNLWVFKSFANNILEQPFKQKKNLRNGIKPVNVDLCSDRQINRCQH